MKVPFVIVEGAAVIETAGSKKEAHKRGRDLRAAGRFVSVWAVADYRKFINPAYEAVKGV